MKPIPRRLAYELDDDRDPSPFELLLTLVVCFLLVCAAAYVGTP